jgi:CRISPR-associated endonuclease Csn1
MKKVLGLDLGTTSIGWALVEQSEQEEQNASIIAMGSRVVPLSTDEINNFSTGKSITTNADRTLKRGARRNLHRYKLRRKRLTNLLTQVGILNPNMSIAEEGSKSTYNTLMLRAKSAKERINLHDFGRVLLQINSKRGYKSNRKANSDEEGETIDSLSVSKELYKNNITPGEYMHRKIQQGIGTDPDFYRSDLESEFEKIWNTQSSYHPSIFTEANKTMLLKKGPKAFPYEVERLLGVSRAELKGNRKEKTAMLYEWRASAANESTELSIIAEVLYQLNLKINSSSGLLAEIADKSKILALDGITVGQYLWSIIEDNPQATIKSLTFYRQDYEDEFERIWDIQSKYHPELTSDAKSRIKTELFYQRPLKSQKGMISFCEFESKVVPDRKSTIQGKVVRIGARVCPRSSPVFQEFRIWQTLNNLEITISGSNPRRLEMNEKEAIFKELNIKDKLTKTDLARILGRKRNELELTNYEELTGNSTMAKFYQTYNQVIFALGYEKIDLQKESVEKIQEKLASIFEAAGINSAILSFHSHGCMKEVTKEPFYELWHLLYSYEGDKSRTGNVSLIRHLIEKYGFSEDGAKQMTKLHINDDYGSLSAKAILKILPHLRAGLIYSDACKQAGYNHSSSQTSEEKASRALKDQLDLIPRNSLRNPVVEKILNQMINLINEVIKTYGKPDKIRIELARELKKNAKERKSMADSLNEARRKHEQYRETIKEEFGLPYVSRNDLVKYKLYLELAENGFKTLYSNQKISHAQLFSKDIDVEHIIPKAKLFDDSFSNKTLEFRQVNLEKGDATAYDYMVSKGYNELEQYKQRIQSSKSLSPRKKKLLLMQEEDIPTKFLERDLRNTQYIARKALALLNEICNDVLATTGKITDQLRTDWQLIDVLKELNWGKYDAVGMTYFEETKDGQKLSRIRDWDKRNDHRHHAMDALAVAFTTPSHIQFLNTLNARNSSGSNFYGLRSNLQEKDENYGKWRFKPPMPIMLLRQEAKRHLENVLVSFKAKNKVLTRNVNRIKRNGESLMVAQDTPRGQLHNETIYGVSRQLVTQEAAVNGSLNRDKVMQVAKKKYREALLKRLDDFGGDPKKAFTGKNSLKKNPIYLDEHQLNQVPEKVKLVFLEPIFSIRKTVGPDLNVSKVLDSKVRSVLQERLDAFGGDSKKAFADIENNPVYFDKAQKFPIKRVRIKGVENAIPLHVKRDHHGRALMDDDGKNIPTSYVSTSNNHHIAIYEDDQGELYEEVVSFFEAVARKKEGLPVVNSVNEQGARLLFTLKQNEYFVFPNESTGFNPAEVDLMNPDNYARISPNLFRVQKISTKYYVFRHHLETLLIDQKELRGITWERIQSLSHLRGLQKVRINHLGRIVHVGEY